MNKGHVKSGWSEGMKVDGIKVNGIKVDGLLRGRFLKWMHELEPKQAAILMPH